MTPKSLQSRLKIAKNAKFGSTEPSDPRVDWLYDQIAQLDPIDRSVCLLMLEGFSYKEMAELLGISESNVGVKIYRIKKRLVGQSREGVSDGI
ncbi:sigma-70 region 4 domain-containing protein [Chloroflexi bacterium TSY]|nr:sigma-70 region 4 domain-containing protein [Chloroflexi bacterium TSY]